MDKTFFQALYPEGIYVIPEKVKPAVLEEEPIAIPVPTVSYVGQNNQRIVILIDDSQSAFGSEGDRDFLSKILGAVKLTFNDVALVNIAANTSLSVDILESIFVFKKLISFGPPLNILFPGNSFSHYKIARYKETEILWSDSLEEIQQDKQKKVKLWEELKKLFS